MLSLGVYFVFMLIYEVTSVRITSEILIACRHEDAPSISVAINTASLGGVTIITIIGGWLANLIGLWWVCLSLSLASLLALIILQMAGAERPAASFMAQRPQTGLRRPTAVKLGNQRSYRSSCSAHTWHLQWHTSSGRGPIRAAG